MKRKKTIIGTIMAFVLLLSAMPFVQAAVPDVTLPTVPVTMDLEHNWPVSWWLIILSDVPSGYDVTNGNYVGWCADPDTFIDKDLTHTVMLYSSYDTALPAHFQNNEWDKVNYILNHKIGDPTNYFNIQCAIWYLLGYGDRGLSATGWAMVNDAILNGEGFVPSSGEIIAIIADPGIDKQVVFFELQLPPEEDGEGNTPGFWKRHQELWVTYIPSQTLDSVFIIPAVYEVGSNTLIEALGFGGGGGLPGAARILMRAAVAALLNAAHPEVNYPLSETEIINQVNNALQSFNRDTIVDLAGIYNTYNNLHSNLG